MWQGSRSELGDNFIWSVCIALLMIYEGYMILHSWNSEAENVPEIDWCEPGEAAAMEVLLGSKDGFLTKRIKNYDMGRNDPTKPRALSCLSPYLHFGHISAQRCALEAKKRRHLSPKVRLLNFMLLS